MRKAANGPAEEPARGALATMAHKIAGTLHKVPRKALVAGGAGLACVAVAGTVLLGGAGGAGATGQGGVFPAVELSAEAQTQATETKPNYVGLLMPHATFRGGDSYTIGYYVSDGKVNKGLSALDPANVGVAGNAATADDEASGNTTVSKPAATADDDKDATASKPAAAPTPTLELSNQTIEASGSGFTALAVQGDEGGKPSVVRVRDLSLTALDNEDGQNANDFVALGSALAVSSASEDVHNLLELDSSSVITRGFCRSGVVVGSNSDAVITNTTITAEGANPLAQAYDGALNTANQRYMIAPPWVLGLMGGARATLVVGSKGSLTVADSVVNTGGWGCLSTDDCTNPVVNAINTDLYVAHGNNEHGIDGGSELFGYATPYGSGYGSYAIGGADENFFGTVFHDVTYATIMTGCGDLYYGPSEPGTKLRNALGKTVYTYEGETQRNTVVNGVWGIMDHQGGTATLDAGSEWNTEEATILKRGEGISTYNLTGAQVRPASGILFQMIDDDDGYGTSPAGGNISAPTYDGRTYGAPTFSGGWWEISGEAGRPSSYNGIISGGYVTSTVNLSNGSYTGDLYNGTGSGSGLGCTGLSVNVNGATLLGAVSSTDVVHAVPYSPRAIEYLDRLRATYGSAGVSLQGGTDGPRGDGTFTVDYVLLNADGHQVSDASEAAWIQLMEFTMNEFYLLGHVANFPVEGPGVNVAVRDGGTWEVTGDSYLSYLLVEQGSTVHVADDATLYVGEREFSGTDVQPGEYGTQVKDMPEDALHETFEDVDPANVVWYLPNGSVPEGGMPPISNDGPPPLPPDAQRESFDSAKLNTSHKVLLWSKSEGEQ